VQVPSSIRVRISSEAAEMIALTPVVVQDMEFGALIELMLALTGKDAERIRGLLARGTLVNGASRLRWSPLQIDSDELASYLHRFPDPNPSRPFTIEACHLIQLRGRSTQIAVTPADLSKRRLFRRRSFWDELSSLISNPRYVTYSYKERADVFRHELKATEQQLLREASGLLTYSTLERQIKSSSVDTLDLFVKR
jgi:hypothetical protein